MIQGAESPSHAVETRGAENPCHVSRILALENPNGSVAFGNYEPQVVVDLGAESPCQVMWSLGAEAPAIGGFGELSAPVIVNPGS